MTEPSIENLNLVDTDYADIIANSINPSFELNLVNLGLNPTEARTKTRFITLMKRKPETPEQWEELMNAWEEACGYRPSDEHFSLISQMLWKD
jgi:hypothetical protein